MNAKFLTSPLCAAFLAVSLPSGNVWAQLYLGDAQGFNATIFGNLIVAGGDTEGRLAVGGNATFTQGGYTVGGAYIGEQNPPSSTRNDLVIGGNSSSIGYIGVEYGSVKVAGTISGTGFGVPNGTEEQLVDSFASTVFDFSATEALIRSYSETFSQLSPNGTVEEHGSRLFLKGSSFSQNVFNVTSSQWNGVSKVVEILVPTGSTTIINISGSSISITNGGMHFLEEWSGPGAPPVPIVIGEETYNRLDQFSAESIDFRRQSAINLYQATTISSTSTGWEGMFIAPDAAFTGSAGWINGQTFLGSANNSNGFEFHNFFNTIPAVIPEPGTLLMAGILLATAAGLHGWRKRRS